jgi:hypothetical protein
MDEAGANWHGMGGGSLLNRRAFWWRRGSVGAAHVNAFGQVSADLPILFVHGNGDQAPIWLPTLLAV